MLFRIALLGIAVMLMPPTLSAQITLDEYRLSVEAYSHQLRDAEFAVHGAHAEMLRVRKEHLPSLSLDGEASLDFRSPAEGRPWSWLQRVELSQPIYRGGAVRAEAMQAELRYAVAEYGADAAMLYVGYLADVAYWALSRAESYYDAIRDYKAIVESLRDVVAERYAAGYISKGDLLQVESRLSDAEYQLSEAQQRRDAALHNFNVLAGRGVEDGVVLHNSIFDARPMLKRESVDAILSRHPDYAISEAEVEISRWAMRSSMANYLPHIEAGLYGVLQPAMPHLRGGDLALDGGVYVSLHTPIFHFGQRKQALSVARSNHMRKVLAVEDVRDDITLRESDGWSLLQSTYDRVSTTERSLTLARENLDMNTYSYREGMATILDVLQAQISWLQIYQNNIAARYDYAVACAAYRYVVGAE